MPHIDCDYCGEEHYRRPANLTDNNFCSNDCYGSWQSENRAGENHHQYDKIEVSCNNCGKVKKVTPSHHDKVDNHYCAPQCQSEYEDRSGKNNPSWSGGKKQLECEQCESEFKIYPHRVDESENHFCSKRCRVDWMSCNIVGEDHHQWKGGGLYYGESWPTMRSKVQERDGNVCQLCGDTEDEIGQTPDVHHIKPVRSFEDFEQAHTMKNMVQVCRGCHRTIEKYDVEKQRKMIE